ncbi:NADP-dependent oxidoreductase [Gordonia sp. HY002]|uniref:NADP-dependent oxidoreductase n=1 Tax=Gordonia zhenghanii TaxID=2911516 RepID=UPI001EF15A0E|nr:NADP-dependent oxidoreductase [Gordonia zhenghanii]MCF8571129.1 NADP-dependent oxidoreductase [Gordonia zhenghanii]MCF8604663.1 NADP-dependent oxidoreductase [Gordonia zhenghanii]
MSDALPTQSREIRLAARPVGEPARTDFETATIAVPDLDSGQVLVRNEYMSVDPYMRGRMNDAKSYVPPFALGEPLDGGAVGEVIASRSAALPVGTTVSHGLGWREYAVLDSTSALPLPDDGLPTSVHLGVLGLTGFTAYVGLFDIASFGPRDTVFVSGAAGAVGSVVGQMAKLRGSPRVIGSAGSAEKVRHLVEDLGFDAAFDYHDGDVRRQLADAAPDGIDVYFDNVGGDHLEAAVETLNDNGRIAACGAISNYNTAGRATGPDNMFQFVTKRLTMRGFIVGDSASRRPDFLAETGTWLREERLRYDETIVDGLANAPQAFLDMLNGANTGKMLVRI